MTGASLKIAFFGHDSAESTVLKRGDAFLAQGCRVQGFMFRRERPGLTRRPAFPTVDLGRTTDRSYLRRLPLLVAGVARGLRHRRLLRQADIVYARNIDMLLVAIATTRLARVTAPLVYEVLDIQRPFVRSDRVGALFRWVERIALRRCRLLVVSSPAFVDHYFGPRQGWWSDIVLLENKLGPASPPPAATRRPAGPPWHIGWFGTLRCRRSFALLCELADALGDQVVIHWAGRPSPVDLTVAEIEAAADARSNVVYHGPYNSPGDLPALYGGVHFSWCVDYIDDGSNSDWLLPNRIYEGGRFGALAIAREQTETGRKVQRDGLGFTFPEPLQAAVVSFFARLDRAVAASAASRVEAKPAAMFVDLNDTAELLVACRRVATLSSRSKRTKPPLDAGAPATRSPERGADTPSRLSSPQDCH